MEGLRDNTKWFTLIGVIITAVLSLYTNQKATVIHNLVNSQFSQAKKEIAEGRVINAVLLKRIAKLTGTTEDEIRAEIAAELAKSDVALPRDEKR